MTTTARGIERWLPVVRTARRYQAGWLVKDVTAGLVLTALLVPAGMGYAAAAGLPPVTGLYATVIPLLAYAVLGPSRILVLGPDSSLAPLIAATVLPLSAGDPEHDVRHLVVGAAGIALVSFADTSVLSRTFAVRHNEDVDADQEMVALGAANVAAGFWQGFPISSSSSRTPVAEQAGSRSQLTGVVGAVAIVVMAPAPLLDRAMPNSARMEDRQTRKLLAEHWEQHANDHDFD